MTGMLNLQVPVYVGKVVWEKGKANYHDLSLTSS